MTHPVIEKLVTDNIAYKTRKNTDSLFNLPAGSVSFSGVLMDSIKFVEKSQLLSKETWLLFVDQFRKGNTDDHNVGWRCEYWGKMMRGAVLCYKCTNSDELYAVLEETVRDMLTTQDSLGRFSTYSKENELQGWDVWGRKYILLGFQFFLEICKDEALKAQIISALIRHADAMIDTIGPYSEGKKELHDTASHWEGLSASSVLEPFVLMYNITGFKRYLDFASYIVDRGGTKVGNLFKMAYENKLAPFQYPVVKAYEMMSNFEGLLEYYRVTGIEKWKEAVINFAHQVAKTDITVIGCSGCTHELFDNSAVRQFDIEEKNIMQETCVTVTWMKFCWQVLCITGDSIFADYIEQSLYNAMLGSINTYSNTHNGGLPFDSYSPLLPGLRGRKMGGYQEMEGGKFYGCCACIGAAGLGLPGLISTMSRADGVAVNFYQEGVVNTLTPAGNALTLKTQTAYPVCGNVRIQVEAGGEEEFVIALRIPSYSDNTVLTVNGEVVPVTPGTYCELSSAWGSGDVIELSFDMRVMEVTPMEYGVSRADAPYAALRRGPIVLAMDARLGNDLDKKVTLLKNEDGSVKVAPSKAPFDALLCLDVYQKDGSTFKMVDYQSAGKTWAEDSRMCAWFHYED